LSLSNCGSIELGGNIAYDHFVSHWGRSRRLLKCEGIKVFKRNVSWQSNRSKDDLVIGPSSLAKIRVGTSSLLWSAATYRTETAALKRRVQVQEATVKILGKYDLGRTANSEKSSSLRLPASGFASLRKKLSISASDIRLPSRLECTLQSQGGK